LQVTCDYCKPCSSGHCFVSIQPCSIPFALQAARLSQSRPCDGRRFPALAARQLYDKNTFRPVKWRLGASQGGRTFAIAYLKDRSQQSSWAHNLYSSRNFFTIVSRDHVYILYLVTTVAIEDLSLDLLLHRGNFRPRGPPA